jgi:hypothetical protein
LLQSSYCPEFDDDVRMYSNQSWYYNFYFKYLHAPYWVTDNSEVNFEEALKGE